MLELDLFPERIIFTKIVAQTPPHDDVRHSVGFAERIRSWMEKRSPNKSITNLDVQAFEENEIFASVADYVYQSRLPKVEFFKSTEELLQSHGLGYEIIQVSSLNDPDFVSLISKSPQKVALYVEGGILRKPVLSSHVRFLHIHPGIVPLVKGSACMLWSALVHNKVGMSCFFMNEGIDTGDILMTKEYPLPRIPIRARYQNPRYAELKYLALEDYLGAAYRADSLRALLRRQPDPALWESKLQDPKDGKLYFHPHLSLRDKAVDKFFTGLQA
ncbi:MAG: hypothetical protein IT314_02385 [Anaerolineales bacterium]|nr:hypothetical protein [Anaerolineales bacterium]